MSFHPYAPGLVLARFARDPEPPTEAEAEGREVAVLWADIVGFTPLTERIVAVGPEGVEHLKAVINRYFDRLAGVVQSHGGDITQLEGDALLAVWDAEGAPTEALLRAAQCALAIQRELDGFQAAEEIRLTQRVALAAGPVRFLTLGGVLARWNFVVAGAPLVQIQAIDHQCEPGEVVVAAEAWPRLASTCEGEPLPTGSVRLTAVREPIERQPLQIPELDEAAEHGLRVMVPGAVLTRSRLGQGEWLAELRTISVVFVQLRNLDTGALDLLETTQALVAEVQHALYRYGGSLLSISMADKGASILAGFGVPPLAHEDDPVRAVLAALELVERLRALGVEAGVGVATGRVFAGLIGSRARAAYTTLGPPTNLASRLMGLAEDVLCDEATWAAADGRLGFEALPARSVKGVAGLVPLYRPTGERRQVVPEQTEIVGRVAEQALVSERLQALLRAHTSGVLVFEGEAGIGKSRLMAEAKARAAELGVPVLVGEASAIERDTPYFVWREVVAKVTGVERGMSTEQAREAVLTFVAADPEWSALAPLLNVLLSIELPDTERTEAMTPQVRADNTLGLLLHIIARGVAERPSLLVLEDAHWFDSASWVLLQAVVRDVTPLLTLIVTRPLEAPAPVEYGQLIGGDEVTVVPLESLEGEQVRALVCQRLGVASLPYGVGQLLIERAGGNPFFSEDLAYALRDSGHLLIDRGTCGLAPGLALESLGLPDTVQGAIVSRVDGLDPASQLVLKVASVVGREFPLRIVQALYPEQDDVAELLDGLVALDFVQREGDGHYLFKHALGRDAVYELMLFAQRRGLHQRAAEWYEAEGADGRTALLAHHWSHTEVHDKALRYLRAAGEEAADRYANVEAARLFERALERSTKVSAGADARALTSMSQRLAVACYALGDYEGCLRHGRAALTGLGHSAPRSTLGKVVGVLGQVARRLVQSRLPGRVDSEDEKARRLAAVRIYTVFSEIGFFTEQPLDTLYASLRQLNLAVPVGPTPELAQAYANMATMVGAIPIRGVATAWGERSREIGDAVGDAQGRAWAYCRSAVVELYFGRWAEVEALTLEALDVAQRLGDRRLREDAGVVRGLGLLYSGRFEQARALSEQVRGWAGKSGNPQTLAWASANLGLALAHLGQGAEALALFDENRAWTEEIATSTERVWCNAAEALARLVAGDRAGALERADLTLPAIAGRPIAYWTGHAPGCLATVYATLLREDPTDADLRDKLKSCAKAAVAFGKVFDFGRPGGLYWTGALQVAEGRPDQGAQTWRDCLDQAEGMDSWLELGLAHRDLATTAEGAQRERHLLEAERRLTRADALSELQGPR